MEKSASEVRQNTCILKIESRKKHTLCNTLCSIASQVDLSCTGFYIFLDGTFKQVKNIFLKLFGSSG